MNGSNLESSAGKLTNQAREAAFYLELKDGRWFDSKGQEWVTPESTGMGVENFMLVARRVQFDGSPYRGDNGNSMLMVPRLKHV